MNRTGTDARPKLFSFKELTAFFLLGMPFYSHYIYHFFAGNLILRTAKPLVYSNIFTLLIYIPFIFSRQKKAIYTIFLLQTLLGAGEFYYLNLFGAPVGKATFYILLETNLSEAAGFLSTYSLYLSLIAYLTIYVFIFIGLTKLFQDISFKRLTVYIMILFCVLGLTLLNKKNQEVVFKNNTILKLRNAIAGYEKEHRKQQELASTQLNAIENVFANTGYQSDETHIVIIGESTNREHMGIYNYFRDTTPHLKEMGKELFVFEDVISPNSHTIPVLRKIMTFSDSGNDKSMHNGSLIHFLKKAGYRTYWLSNQVPLGQYENLVTVMAKTCDTVLFVNYNERYNDYSLDEAVLKPLDNILEDRHSKKYIFIHLMGNHAPYCKRHSGSFEMYKEPLKDRKPEESEKINCYDNSVLYNDYIVSDIIKRVKKKNSYSSVLYFSDHGEDVYDSGSKFLGHIEADGTKYMFDIPFVLWLSEEYRNMNKMKVARFSSYLKRRYMSDDVKHTIFDLLNIKCNSCDMSKSLLSEAFKSKPRIVYNRDYDLDIAKEKNLMGF
jgi:heptose-I-phosphate ethanolaminephosphotransferase